MFPAYNESDLFLIMALRRAHIEITPDGRLKIKFEESAESVAKTLRDYIIKETNSMELTHSD